MYREAASFSDPKDLSLNNLTQKNPVVSLAP